MVGKLGRYFNKVSGDEKMSLEDKVKGSERLSEKAQVRVEKMRKNVEGEMEQYRSNLRAKEENAVEEAKKSVTTLVSKAQVCSSAKSPFRERKADSSGSFSLTGGTRFRLDLARRRNSQGLATLPRSTKGRGKPPPQLFAPSIW